MANLLKDIYHPIFFNSLVQVLAEAIPAFDKQQFMNHIHDAEWEQRALKQRMKHIARALHLFLPASYPEAIQLIKKIILLLRERGHGGYGIEYMFLPEYIELYGIDDYHTSVNAIEMVTQFTSCEYAVRPFVIKYPGAMMRQMQDWAVHESYHVRRLASEGCRPRLPWAMALPSLKKDPRPVMAVLEKLKNDSHEFVRRSVANNLNDIAKDHPDLVMETAGRWKGQSPETDWIIRHGCRTLLRKANTATLQFFGLAAVDNQLTVTTPQLDSETIAIGGDLKFAFTLKLHQAQAAKLRIEYAIDYMKANGRPNRKIFKLAENTYAPGRAITFRRYQSFRDLTTRKHYAGPHKICIIVNGREMAGKLFNVNSQLLVKGAA